MNSNNLENKINKMNLKREIGSMILIGSLGLLGSCTGIPGQQEDQNFNYNTKPQVVKVSVDKWKTLPGDLEFKIEGDVREGNKVFVDLDVNGKDYYTGSVTVKDGSFVFTKIIDSNLYYSNLVPLDVDVRLSLNSDFATSTEYSTIITLPIPVMGRKAKKEAKKIEDLINLYDNDDSYSKFEESSLKEVKKVARGVLDKDDEMFYLEFDMRRYHSSYISSLYVFKYSDEKGSLILALDSMDVFMDNLTDSSIVIYDVSEYNTYKGLSLEDFISTYLSKMATSLDKDSVEMMISTGLFKKMVNEDFDFSPLSYRRIYVFNDHYDVDKPVFGGLYVLENYTLPNEDVVYREPIQRLDGAIIFKKNFAPPVLFLVSPQTNNILEISYFKLDDVGDFLYYTKGPALISPYLRDALNVPGKPSGYEVNTDAIGFAFDRLFVISSESTIITPEYLKENRSTDYNRAQSALDDAIKVIDELINEDF